MFNVAYSSPMQLGECPLWCPEREGLFWVDIADKSIHLLDQSNRHRSWPMPSEPAAIARCASGGLVVAMRNGISHFDPNSATLTEIVGAPYDTAVMRFNDGRCDARGRFWIGTIYEPRDQQNAQMYYLEYGKLNLAWSGGMTVSNGLAFSPDNRTLYHADTTSHTIRCYAFDLDTAQVGAVQVIKRFSTDKIAPQYGGRPDGAAVDSEGAYWCAMYEGGRLLRLAPDGEILRELALPLRCPTMLAFGGTDLRTLYVTSTSHQRPVDELARFPLSGCVLSYRIDVPGLIEPVYQNN